MITQQQQYTNVIKTVEPSSQEEEQIEAEELTQRIEETLSRDIKLYSVSEFMTHAASKNQILNLLIDRGKCEPLLTRHRPDLHARQAEVHSDSHSRHPQWTQEVLPHL